MESNAPTGIRKSIMTAVNSEGGLTIKALQDILAVENISASKVSPNVRYAVDDGLLKSEIDQQDGKQVVMYVLTDAGREWVAIGGKKPVHAKAAPVAKVVKKAEKAKPVSVVLAPTPKQKVTAKVKIKPEAHVVRARKSTEKNKSEENAGGAQFYLVEEGAKLLLADLSSARSFPSLGVATTEASRLVGAGDTGSSKLVVIQVHALVSPSMTSIVRPNPLAK